MTTTTTRRTAPRSRALYANLIFDLEEEGNPDGEEDVADAHLILMRAAPPSLDRVRAALLSVRRTLRATPPSSSGHHYYYD
jgi:hypothetical protein